VLITLILFVLIYLTLLGTYVWYVARVVREGPDDVEPLAEAAAASLRPAPLPRPAPAS
jgi:cytochrome bd-type quinol oxidase subunit 1